MGADFIATGLWRRGSIRITDAEAEATRERIRALTPAEIAKRMSMLWESYEDDPYGMLDLDAEREFDPKAEAETIADAIRKTLEGDFDWLFDVALKGGDRGVTTMQVGPYEVLLMGEMSWGDIGDEQEGLGRIADSRVLVPLGFHQYGYPGMGEVLSAVMDVLIDRYVNEGYDEGQMRDQVIERWRLSEQNESYLWESVFGPVVDQVAEAIDMAPFPPEPYPGPDHSTEETSA